MSKAIDYPPCKDDYLVAITVIEYKMRVLSNKFRSDDGGWKNEKVLDKDLLLCTQRI